MEKITTIIIRVLLVVWFLCLGMIMYLSTRPNKDEGAIVCFCMFILFIPRMILGFAFMN